jgi:hypothetical protein
MRWTPTVVGPPGRINWTERRHSSANPSIVYAIPSPSTAARIPAILIIHAYRRHGYAYYRNEASAHES